MQCQNRMLNNSKCELMRLKWSFWHRDTESDVSTEIISLWGVDRPQHPVSEGHRGHGGRRPKWGRKACFLRLQTKCHPHGSNGSKINYTANLWNNKCHPRTSDLTGWHKGQRGGHNDVTETDDVCQIHEKKPHSTQSRSDTERTWKRCPSARSLCCYV